MNKIFGIIITTLIFIGFFWGIAFLLSIIFPPEPSSPQLEHSIYPNYEEECIPNYMGSCDPQ